MSLSSQLIGSGTDKANQDKHKKLKDKHKKPQKLNLTKPN